MAWVAIGALLVHIAVKLPIIRGALSSRRRRHRRRPADRRPSPGADLAPRPAADDVGGRRRGGRWPSRAAPCRCCATSRSSPSAPATGRRASRSTSPRRRRDITDDRRSSAGVRLRSSTATRTVALTRDDLLAMTQRTQTPAHRVRRGVERERGPGPASGCATCSTWSARRRAATSTSTRSSRRGPYRHTRPAGELRRRRPDAASRSRSTASRCRVDHG